MTQQLSELMDGEQADSASPAAWRNVAEDPALRDTWHTYHLIGDCLRGEVPSSALGGRAAAEAVFAKLASEPTVLAPSALRGPAGAIGGRTRVALALAASVATLGVIGMIATREPSRLAAPVDLAQSTPRASTPANDPAATPQVNDYLALHRQFANSAGLQAAALTTPARERKAAQ